MKVQITLKSPDCLYHAMYDTDMNEEQREEFLELCKQWFEYGEYLTVEVDTEERTCVVV